MNYKEGFAHLLLVAALAVVVFGGAVTVVAADGAKPGDLLYSVDRNAENVREALVFSEEAKADFKLKQADERLEELEALQTEEASEDLVDSASNTYGATISEAAQAVAAAAQSGEGFDEAHASLIAEATGVHLDVLANVFEQVPEEAKDSIEKAMENSEKGAERSLEALNGQLAEEKRQQLEDKIEESRQRRGAPEGVPGNNDAAEGGQGNIPEQAGRP